MTGALDRPVHVTLFATLAADTRQSLFLPLTEFAERLRDARAPTKAMLQLFSPCSYDNARTSRKSLRHDGNVRECFCIVGDYDRERVSFDDMVAAGEHAGLALLFTTTASHTPVTPRCRVIAPLATPLHKNGSLREHAKLTSRLAGIFPDNINPESWTLSQSWYVGTIDGAPDHRVVLLDGDYLDERVDLDATAKPKPAPAPKAQAATAAPKTHAKARPASAPALDERDGAAGADQDSNTVVPVDAADALAAISAGSGSHDALVSLSGRFAAQGMPLSTAEAILLNAADLRSAEKRDAGWIQMRASIRRTLDWAYAKEAEAQGHLQAALASATRRHKNGGSAAPPLPLDDPGSGESSPPPGNGTGGASPGTSPPQRPDTGTSVRGMIRDRRPRYAGNVANVITALLSIPALTGCIAFDEMAMGVSLRRPLPGDDRFTEPRPWTDDDTGRLQDWLQRNAEMGRVSKGTVDQGIDHVARMHPFHPVKNYLADLTWDGVPRADTWLNTYLGVEASDYAKCTGRWWLIGLVARIMQPGCRTDHMLILEGLQGTQKSQVCVALCGPWVSDQSLDIRGDARAASQHLRNKWLVEISELAFFRQADVENLKAFLTRPVERYLPRYAHREVVEPRQCGFIGTTNHSGGYLHDPTGNRRFWPHRTDVIDIPALTRDRDLLWAEVVAAFRAGEPWWPPRDFEQVAIAPEQAVRYDADAWLEPIERELQWLVAEAENARWDLAKLRLAPQPAMPRARTTLLQIWQAALTDFNANTAAPLARDFDRSAQIRVREILQFLGWQRGARGHGGVRWWVEPLP